MATYFHRVGQEFKSLPEIYQVELTSACNLKCPMCLRTTEMVRSDQLLKFELLEKMYNQGDFQGSFFVELQMAGEPTLHPHLKEVIYYLKNTVKVLVGLSTHGLLMVKKPVLEALMELNALTVSVDSVDPEIYAKMRYPAKLETLFHNLDLLFSVVGRRDRFGLPRPFIELQLVVSEIVEKSGNVKALRKVMVEKGWDKYATIRTTGDCFYEMDGRMPAGSVPRNQILCLNPFSSVSVAHDGGVVSCCYIFEPNPKEVNYYGNLNEQTLKEIWYGERVKKMQENHMKGNMLNQCAKCYLKSPCQIHTNIVSRLVQFA